MSPEIVVRLHKPHEKQLLLKTCNAKRVVVLAGRRFGKTTVVADIAVERALNGYRILEAAPTADQTNAFWESCKASLVDMIAAGLAYKNDTDRVLRFPNGGQIKAKTAWDADSLRGDYADLLILDEYSLMDPSAWDEVGAPMLLDNDGSAIFIFTPKRKNHAFKLYQRAIGDATGRWAAFHFTSYDNPYLSKEALEEITSDMTEDAYRQEILAEFLEGEGTVFRNLDACMKAPKDARPEQHAGHRIVAGVDWGKQGDFTAISVFCADCACEVAIDRFNQIDYAFQRKRLVAMVHKWGVSLLVPEANAMGEPIIEELQRDKELSKVTLSPFTTTESSKTPLIESLALAFEQEEAQWIDNAVWKGELEAYERKVSQRTGRSSYSAPEGVHDDCVMARALAWHAGGQKGMTYQEYLRRKRE
jgi:hypothetical protein